MKSVMRELGGINLPYIQGEFPMIPFDVETFNGLPEDFKGVAKKCCRE